MTKPQLLDLGCKAGGATKGYQRAGYYVIGVDIEPQPHYCGDEFFQADMLTFPLEDVDLIHVSPPCQRWSRMSGSRPGLQETYPDLITPMRERLRERGIPWVMENVVGAPLLSPVILCGWTLGLRLYRHRLFETSFPLTQPAHFKHSIPASSAGHWVPGTIISVAGHFAPMSVAQEAMGIDWMNAAEMAESIPPAMTEWIAKMIP